MHLSQRRKVNREFFVPGKFLRRKIPLKELKTSVLEVLTTLTMDVKVKYVTEGSIHEIDFNKAILHKTLKMTIMQETLTTKN